MREKALLIISESGRSLAASVSHYCFEHEPVQIVTIDHFADQDTQQFCREVIRVSNFEASTLLPMIKKLLERYEFEGILIGSGFESDPYLINVLAELVPVISNSASTMEKLSDPEAFFDQLENLQIPFPKTIFTSAEILPDQEWLLKRTGSSGGRGIKSLATQNAKELHEGSYLQARLSGQAGSCVFLADGEKVLLVGLNRTFTREGGFEFLGAASLDRQTLEENPSDLTRQILGILERLVPEFKLRGLNGLDFIIKDGVCNVLEVNPRPTATYELHDTQEHKLIKCHIQLCSGYSLEQVLRDKDSKSDSLQGMEKSRAKLLLYADQNLLVTTSQWPEWVTDIPHSGTRILANTPICSVYADAKTADSAEKIVHNRRDKLYKSILKEHVVA